MKTGGYYKGTSGEIDALMAPMNDRAGYCGDGVYDASYAVNGLIFALDDHFDRFFKSAGLLEIKFTLTKADLKALVQDLVKKGVILSPFGLTGLITKGCGAITGGFFSLYVIPLLAGEVYYQTADFHFERIIV